MATVTGYRTTGNQSSDQLKIDIGREIALLEPDATPLQRLVRELPKEAAVNSTFSWLERGSFARFDTTSGAVASTTTTTLPVTNGAYWAEHYLGLNTATQEVFRVVAVNGNNLTITRGWGTTAVNFGSGDELLVLGIAQPEGDTSRTPRSDNPTKVTNYTQILREPYALSGTALSSDNQVNPHDWDLETKTHLIEHKKDIEYSFLFGAGNVDTSATPGPRRSTKGATRFITTNTTAVGGTMSETSWNTFLRTLARYGGPNRTVFVSSVVMSAINQYGQGKILTDVGGTQYGFKIRTYISPFGDANIVYHPLLEGTKYSGYAIALDMTQLKYRYLGGGKDGSRDTHVRTNIQENDRDGRKDEVLSEVGLQFGLERRHGLATGITG